MALELRPRDRLLRQGPESLTDTELIAVLIRAGRPGAPPEEIAASLIRDAGGLDKLLRSDRQLLRLYGASDSKAAILLASQELACRTLKRKANRRTLKSPAAVADYVAMRYGIPDQEVLGAFYVDGRNRLIIEKEIFRGTMWRASAEPRQILREAVSHHAAGVVIWHTHPSGDPTASEEDLEFTRRLDGASDLVGVRLVDHLIFGSPGRWVSLRLAGW